MANDRDETRMHGNPEMHGRHDAHGRHGLSEWGQPETQGREHTGYGAPQRFDQHGGQTGQGWHSADSGGMGRPSDADQRRMSGVRGDHDPHHHDYRNWRDQQMQAFDREYEEYRRHRQERFNADFEEWRKGRGGSGNAEASSMQAPGERISTTQRPSGPEER